MIDPGFALLVFAVTAGLCLALLWPGKGLLARALAAARMTERVRIEDALKHLFNCEYLAFPSTLESLAGGLRVRRSRAGRLVSRLCELGLAEARGSAVSLTDAGRSYALRVVRTHRLWERYLADRTGVSQADWNAQAEVREHRMSEAETEALAARPGHPRFDPHGDPIPTAQGEVPPRTGISLTQLRPGMGARIVHLEDEPREIHLELLAEQLSPGMEVRVMDISPTGVRFLAQGKERLLDPVAAASVTVEAAEDMIVPSEPPQTLADLELGETGVVDRMAPACQGPARRRLLDLGVVPGTPVRATLRGAGGDPTAYEIRGATIALRKEQASWVEIARAPAVGRAFPEGSLAARPGSSDAGGSPVARPGYSDAEGSPAARPGSSDAGGSPVARPGYSDEEAAPRRTGKAVSR